MINLYAPIKNSMPPSTCFFCHHRLSIDYQELFNEKIRMSSNKCITEIAPPYFCDENYIVNCQILAKEGFYQGIVFNMKIILPKEYPFSSPKIFSSTKVAHPNIHLGTGEVFISMLKETEWIPVLNLNFILFALELVIIQPNITCTPDYAPNKELVRIYQKDLDLFESLIEKSKIECQVFDMDDKITVEGMQESQTFMGLEKQLSQMKMNENIMKPEGIIRSLKYEFEKLEPKKKEILEKLNETLINFENSNAGSKKRQRDEDSLINPFLKKVKISSG